MSIWKKGHAMITGGTGSFGRLLANHLIQNEFFEKVTIFSRDEHKQFEMRLQYPESQYPFLNFVLGDIRDLERISQVTRNVDVIFHVAALKHVHIAEQNPLECIKTNVLGTENVIKAATLNKVKNVVVLSSDKAAAPHNLYGATKFCADKLVIAAQNETKDTIFSIVRLGNVVNSRGSVFEIFEKKKSDGVFYITHQNATRFINTAKQGIHWILFSLMNAKGGEIFIPKIHSFKITDLAAAISEKSTLNFIGLKLGEKLHEDLITATDSFTGAEFDGYYVIYPSVKACVESGGKRLPEEFTFSSNLPSNYLSVAEIKAILEQEKYILNL